MLLKFDVYGKESRFDLRENPNAWMGTYECGPLGIGGQGL